MNAQEAIITFAQSDKIKAGLIWASQTLEVYIHLPEEEKPGAIKMIRIFINTILHDVNIARQATHDHLWHEVEKTMDMAVVMIDSGVPQEATFHLGQALSKVTTIAQRGLSFLKDEGLL